MALAAAWLVEGLIIVLAEKSHLKSRFATIREQHLEKNFYAGQGIWKLMAIALRQMLCYVHLERLYFLER